MLISIEDWELNELNENIIIYQQIDKIAKIINNIFDTYSILELKFLNLYAWIFAIIKNHHIKAKKNV